MLIRRIIIISVLLILNCSRIIPAQIQDSTLLEKNQFPVDISFLNHAVTMPFDGIILSPVHPGISIGTEYYYINRLKGQLFQDLHTGFFYNKYVARALFLETLTGYRYSLLSGLFADAGAGIGYLHSFHPSKDVFALSTSGEYEKTRDQGKPAFTVSVEIGIGYDFHYKTGCPVSAYLRYQPFIQMPYSKESFLYPHLKISFGIRAHLSNRRKGK